MSIPKTISTQIAIVFLIGSISACGVYTTTLGTSGITMEKVDSLIEGETTTNDVVELFKGRPDNENIDINSGEYYTLYHSLRRIEQFTGKTFSKKERAEFDLNKKYILWDYHKIIRAMASDIGKPIYLLLLFDENGVLVKKYVKHER